MVPAVQMKAHISPGSEITSVFCNTDILILYKSLLLSSRPNYICWGSRASSFTNRNLYLCKCFMNSSSNSDVVPDSWVLTMSFALKLDRFICSTIETIPNSPLRAKANVRRELAVQSHLCSGEVNEEYPVHIICCTWKISVSSRQARLYPVPSLTWFCLAKLNIKIHCWHIGKSRTWELPSTYLKPINSWWTEGLTRPVSPIPKEEPHKHSVLLGICLLCSIPVYSDSLPWCWDNVCLLARF